MTDSLPTFRNFPVLIAPALIAAYLASSVAAFAGSPQAAPTKKTTSTSPPQSKKATGDGEILSTLLSPDTDPNAQVRVVPADRPAWYPQFEQALAATQAGKHALAETIYRKMLKAQPRVPEAWANLGILEAQDRNDALAISDSEKAISFTTDAHLKVTMLTQIMRLNAHSSNWPGCAAAARRVLEAAPEGSSPNTLANAYLGISLMRLGRFAEAVAPLRKRAVLVGEPAIAGDLRLIYVLEQTNHADEAFTEAQELAKRLPKDASAQVALGDAAVLVNRIDIAMAAFGTAYLLRPDDIRAGKNAVSAAAQLGRKEVAFELLNRMIKRSPDDPQLHYILGKLYFVQPENSVQQYVQAERNLSISAAKNPTGPGYISLLAQSILMQRKPERFAEAQKLCQSALHLDPHDALAHLGLGYLAEQQVQFDKTKGPDHYVEAIAEYKTIIADGLHNGFEAKARRRLAGIYLTLGKKEEGYREFEALIKQFPADTADLSELATIYYGDSRYKEAESAYRRLIAGAPQNPAAYIGLGETFERLQEPAAAQQQYEAALKAEPGNATAALALGILLKSEKHDDAADAVFEAALKVKPGNNQLHLQLGSDFEQQGKLDEAIKQYQALTVLNDDPNRVSYLLMAPTVLLSHARGPEAETMLKRIFAEHPKDDAIAFKLATAEEHAGHPAAAELTLRTVVAKHATEPPESIAARLELSKFFERTSKPEEAASGFEDILRIDLGNKEALAGLSRARTAQQHPEAAGTFLESLALGDPAAANMAAVEVAEQLYDTMDRTPERYSALLGRLTDKFPNDRPLAMLRIEHLLNLGGVQKPENRVAAEKLLQPLLLKTPNDPDLLFRIGTIREQDGRKSEAIADYTAAVKQNYGYGPAIIALKHLNADVPVAPPPAAKPAVATLPATGKTDPPAPKTPPKTNSEQRP